MKVQLQPKFGRKNPGASDDSGNTDEPEAEASEFAVNAPAAPLASELPPPPPIPLDLATALPRESKGFKHIVIKVERMAQGAGLTVGRNNGDRTWSLGPDEIKDVAYVLEHGPLIPHTLQVRVIGMSDDQATTLNLLETDIGTDGVASPLRLFTDTLKESKPAAAAAGGDDLETADGLSRAINQSRQTARARIAAAKAAAAADEGGITAEAAADAAALRERLQALETALSEREQEFSAAQEAWETERKSLAADAKAKIAAALDTASRTTHDADSREAARREHEARAAWEREKELLLAEANVRVEEAVESSKPDKVRARLGAEFDHERAKLAAEADKRVAAAEKAARAEAKAAAEAKLKAARKEADEIAKRADAAIEAAREEAAQALTEARTAWEQERQMLVGELDRRIAQAADAARQKAESNATRAFAAAQTEWETESKALRAEANKRIAAAAEITRREADEQAAKNLAAALAKWKAETAALHAEAERITAAKLGAATAAWQAERNALAETHGRELTQAVEAARGEAEQALKAERRAWGDERKAITAAAEQGLSNAMAARGALEAELAGARSVTGIAVDRAKATWDIEMAALRSEMEAKIAAARKEGEAAGRAAAAMSFAGDEAGAMVAARAEWERELAATVARVRQETAAEAKSAAAGTLGAAVEAARAEWKAERYHLEAHAQEGLDAARLEAETARREIVEARAAWETEKKRLLADADARIAAAGAGDADAASAEAARREAAVDAALSDAEMRWRREIEIQADANEKRLAAMRVSAESELDVERQKAVKTALAQARTKWEAEVETRLAKAHEAWKADESKRIAATEKQLEGALAKRLEAVEAKLIAPALAGARAVAGSVAKQQKKGKGDSTLAATIAKWNKSHRRSKKFAFPRVSRRLALAAICVVALVGGGDFYREGVSLYRQYAPAAEAEVGARAGEVTSQAREFAARVGAAIREQFPDDSEAEQTLAESPLSANDVLTSVLRRAWIKPDSANMRAEPSPDGALVATLSRGAQVEQLGARGVWIHVRTAGANGQEGWVHASLLSSRAPE
jgi:hypothetical protein